MSSTQQNNNALPTATSSDPNGYAPFVATGKQKTKFDDYDMPLMLAKCNQIKPEIERFWEQVKTNWESIRIYLMAGQESGLHMVNSYLTPVLNEYVEIEASFGEINRQALPMFKNVIELYISPKFKKDNVWVMKLMYHMKPNLINMMVSCYKAYHPLDNVIQDITYRDFKVSYDDFGYQGSVGYDKKDNECKPLINMVILVKKPICDKILKKQNVTFQHPDGKTSEREVYFPNNCNAFDMLLLNIVGEYNLINHVGYIEFLPEDDPQITENAVFVELADIRKDLELIHSNYVYRKCNFCDHNELQVQLQDCYICKHVMYCSVKCKAADRKNHNKTCMANITGVN